MRRAVSTSRHTRGAALLATACLVLVVSGCGDQGSTAAPSGGVGSDVDLAGRTFAGDDLDSPDHRIVRGSTIRLDFDDEGRLGAHAGCNHLGAAARVVDGRLVVSGGVSMTEMACQEALMAQDDWLIGFLSDEPDITLEDGVLTLSTGGTVLRLDEQPRTEPPADGDPDEPTSSG